MPTNLQMTMSAAQFNQKIVEHQEQCTNEQNVQPLPPYMYSFRVDLHHKYTSEKLILQWIKHFNCIKYLCAKEFGKTTKKSHYQGAVWFNERPKETNARNWWRNKTISKKGGHSFTKAITPASLAKYCNNKEKNGLFTNLSSYQIKEIGTWKDFKADNKKFKEKLDNYLKELAEDNNNYPNIPKYDLPEIIFKITDFCYNNDRNGLTNHHLLNVLRKHHLIGTDTYNRMKYPIIRAIDNY